MDSVIIVAPHEYENIFRSRLSLTSYSVVEGSDSGIMVIEDGRTRVYLARSDRVREDFEPASLARIDAAMPGGVFYTMDFSDIDFCRSILIQLVNDAKLLVDDDHGLILSGPEFVRRLQDPASDWRDRRTDRGNV